MVDPDLTRAIADALEQGPDDTDDPIADELAMLWDDLDRAQHYALNGRWSMDCDSKVYRIIRLTKHTGKPTPWDQVQVSLLLNGWYEAINAGAGFPTPLTDEQRAEAQRCDNENKRPLR
jgi:hypothetical protein